MKSISLNGHRIKPGATIYKVFPDKIVACKIKLILISVTEKREGLCLIVETENGGRSYIYGEDCGKSWDFDKKTAQEKASAEKERLWSML